MENFDFVNAKLNYADDVITPFLTVLCEDFNPTELSVYPYIDKILGSTASRETLKEAIAILRRTGFFPSKETPADELLSYNAYIHPRVLTAVYTVIFRYNFQNVVFGKYKADYPQFDLPDKLQELQFSIDELIVTTNLDEISVELSNIVAYCEANASVPLSAKETRLRRLCLSFANTDLANGTNRYTDKLIQLNTIISSLHLTHAPLPSRHAHVFAERGFELFDYLIRDIKTISGTKNFIMKVYHLMKKDNLIFANQTTFLMWLSEYGIDMEQLKPSVSDKNGSKEFRYNEAKRILRL